MASSKRGGGGGGGGIDYSKWDRMEFSSDDDSEDECESTTTGPARVTRLDGPSRVTRQSNGTVTIAPSQSVPPDGKSTTTTTTVATTTAQSLPKKESLLLDNNGWTRNGASEWNSTLFWCQDRYNVVFRYKLPEGVTGKDVDVQVDGALPYQDRYSAVATTLPFLKITKKKKDNHGVLLQGTLPHPVYLAQDEEDGMIDWTVEQPVGGNRKYVVITLHKAVPMQGVTLWWRRALQQLPERDVVKNDASATGSEKFQRAWEEAHEQFRAKMAAQSKQQQQQG